MIKKVKLALKDSKGRLVSAALDYPPKSKSVVICCHGFESNKDSRTYRGISDSLAQRGISALRLDFFGHGESEGKLEDVTLDKALDDIRTAHEYCVKRGFTQVSLAGSSFGAFACAVYASRYPGIHRLALKAPAIDYGSLYKRFLNEKRLAPRDATTLNYTLDTGEQTPVNYAYWRGNAAVLPAELAKATTVPTLLINGTRDDTTLVNETRRFYRQLRCKKKLVVVKGADHFFSNPVHFRQMTEEIGKWLSE